VALLLFATALWKCLVTNFVSDSMTFVSVLGMGRNLAKRQHDLVPQGAPVHVAGCHAAPGKPLLQPGNPGSCCKPLLLPST